MSEDREIIIEHPDGRRYGVAESAFYANQDDVYAGFKPVSFADGTEYQAPSKKEQKKLAEESESK